MLRIDSRNGLMESNSASRNLGEEMEKGECQIDMKKKLPDSEIQGCLKQEILQLKKRLNDQLAVRYAMEKALGCRTTFIDSSSSDSFIPIPAKELIREIAVLELEVMHLEHHLLSLYRRAFDLMPPKERSRETISCQRMLFQDPKPQISSMKDPAVNSTRILPSQTESLGDLEFHRSHSVRDHGAAVYSSRIPPSQAPPPLSFFKDGLNPNSGVISLAEYLGASIADHVPETPNKISEEMVRCMGAIYSKVAECTQNPNPDPASSPTSSLLSSMSASSPQYIGDMWSPGCENRSNLNTRIINPFRIEGLREFCGPYNAMVEVSSISRDSLKLKIVEDLFSTFESLVQKLATVDVRRMTNDEKMAFWINLHNALMMHATCIVGGHSIDAKMIQASILGCCTHFSGQWLQTLKHPRIYKLSTRAERGRSYAIEKKEPLLRFALCSGSHSDPAVRIYSAKRLYQQLETAKEEYIRAAVGVQREQRILLPELVESYAKDLNLNSQKVADMIQCHLHEAMRIAVQRCRRRRGRSRKIVEWVPHKFSFRYLLAGEVANPQII